MVLTPPIYKVQNATKYSFIHVVSILKRKLSVQLSYYSFSIAMFYKVKNWFTLHYDVYQSNITVSIYLQQIMLINNAVLNY